MPFFFSFFLNAESKYVLKPENILGKYMLR